MSVNGLGRFIYGGFEKLFVFCPGEVSLNGKWGLKLIFYKMSAINFGKHGCRLD